MALTRKLLKSLGLEDSVIDTIIEEHSASVDALKEQINGFKADAEKLPDIQAELETLRAEKAENGDWKSKYVELEGKYNDEHGAFEKFKTETSAKETARNKRSAYRALLKAQNVDEKRIDSILRVTDLSEKKLTKDGKLEGENEILESIKSEWGDFIVTQGTRPSGQVETPPANEGGTTLTKEEIMNIKDTAKRQKAIADNPKLFGLE